MISPGINAFPQMETARLLLRLPDHKDAEQVFLLRSDPLVNKFIGRKPCENVDEAGKFIQFILTNVSSHQSIYWAIQLRDNPLLAGTICLWNYNWDNESVELGFELLPTYQGKGYIKEAVSTVSEYAFENMKIKTLRANTDPGNKASIAVLLHAGFKKRDGLTDDGEMQFYKDEV